MWLDFRITVKGVAERFHQQGPDIHEICEAPCNAWIPSQYTGSVSWITVPIFLFKGQFLGYGFLKLDGSTKQADREFIWAQFIFRLTELSLYHAGMPMIDKFHSDPEVFIFLISTLAGGTGLNLTGTSDQLFSLTIWDTTCWLAYFQVRIRW